MNKFKKLLLTLAPLSAVAIATPIILTSCSTNATAPNGSTDQKPGEGGGSGSGGGGDTGTNGNITPDDTNRNDFKPTTENGLFANVEKTVKAGLIGKEDSQVDAAFVAYTTAKEQDIKDSIDIWSNNKWFGASKNDGVTYSSNLLDWSVTNKEESGSRKWTISFKYKFQISVTANGTTENVLAEKTYNVVDADLSKDQGIANFETKATLFMVNGKSMLDENQGEKSLFSKDLEKADSKVVQDVRNFLNDKNSKFDAKANYKEFITNHGIKGEQTIPTPVWQAKSSDKKAVVNGDTMTVTLDGPWTGDIKKDATHAQIKAYLKKPETNAFILTYVNDSSGWTATFDEGALDTSTKKLTFKMTLTRSEVSEPVVLNLVFTPVNS